MVFNVDEILSSINKKFDGINKNVELKQLEVQETLNSLRNYVCDEMKIICEQIKKLKSNILIIEDRLDFLERDKRANDLVITGIPINRNVDVYEIVSRICDVLGASDITKSIGSVFTPSYRTNRIDNYNNKNADNNNKGKNTNSSAFVAPIVLKFLNRDAKINLFNAYIKFKNLNLSHIGLNSTTRIYFNDGLTKTNSNIFQYARQLHKQDKIIKATTKRGLVFVSLHNQPNSVLIKSVKQLNLLIENHHNELTTKQQLIPSTLNIHPHSSSNSSSYRDISKTKHVKSTSPTTVAQQIDSCVEEVFELCLQSTSSKEPAYKLRARKPE